MNYRPRWKNNKVAYNIEYIRNNVTRYGYIIKKADEDLYNWLMSKPNKQGYIKSLIQADMDRVARERIKKDEKE